MCRKVIAAVKASYILEGVRRLLEGPVETGDCETFFRHVNIKDIFISSSRHQFTQRRKTWRSIKFE